MKKLFYAFIMLSFFLVSCGGGTEQASDSDEAVKTEQSDEISDVEDQAIKDCEDFLDDYDEWTDEYLKVMKSWKEDPTNPEVGEKYMKLSEDMTVWFTDWTSYAQCASSEKYQKRFEEIADKVEKGLEEMGFTE